MQSNLRMSARKIAGSGLGRHGARGRSGFCCECEASGAQYRQLVECEFRKREFFGAVEQARTQPG